MNRRELLKNIGVAGLVSGVGLGIASIAEASDGEKLETVLPWYPNALNVLPYLSPKAKAAYHNVVKGPLYQIKADGVTRTYPAQFICQGVVGHEALPQGFVREWADMLNTFAESGWVASVMPAGTLRLAATHNYDDGSWGIVKGESCVDLLPHKDGYRCHPTLGWIDDDNANVLSTTRNQAVFSFLLFEDSSIISPDDLNKRFGFKGAQLEGAIGMPAMSPGKFRWRNMGT